MYSPRVLLVEDNSLLRWWLRKSLEQENMCVVAAKSLKEAIENAQDHQDHPFDAVITDWRLSEDEDGFKVLTHIRQDFPRTFSILISAQADPQFSEYARSAGFNLVFQKPFPVSDIVAAIRSAVERELEGSHEAA